MTEYQKREPFSPGRTVQLDLENYSNVAISATSSRSKNRQELSKHQPAWADLEWKSKYRFWDSNEMFMYSQMKLKYWMENRKENNYEPYPSAQELISRYLRPLKYRQQNVEEDSSADTRSKCSDGRSAIVLGSEWWTKLPAISNDDLCTHCWKCAAEQVSTNEAEKNYTSVMSGRVEKELKVLIKRWKKDKTLMGFLSIFGGNFNMEEIYNLE